MSELELDTFNVLRPQDAGELEKFVLSIAKPNMITAEVGTWKGYSASIIGKVCKLNLGHHFVVDHWLGDSYSTFDVEAQQRDIFVIFRENMKLLDLWGSIVHPLYMNSHTASMIFKDNILDMIFIDGEHSYEAVKQDITDWLPKVKIGGWITGHDLDHKEVKQVCEELLPKYEMITQALWKWRINE